MKKLLFATLLFASASAQAAELKVNLDGIDANKPIDPKFAQCIVPPAGRSAPGQSLNPKISWDKGPEGTESYAVIMVDHDVPTDIKDANKEGKTIPEMMPRKNFYHWIILNIPTSVTAINEGARTVSGADMLVNDYLKFYGLDNTIENAKKFSWYNGPCPPWNDERVHYYHFKVLALSNRFNIPDEYEGDEMMKKLTPYILAEGSVIGSYTLNTNLKKIGWSQCII